MVTDSTELKLIGRPLPLDERPMRMPLRNMSAIWPRRSGVVGAPKFERVYELAVSLEKSRTSWIETAVNCSREMIVADRGVSSSDRSLP
jgi:hypothetical protein